MAQPEENTRRIVLLGKSGTGKSSLANTLFGEEDTFKASCSAKSTTRFCQSETRTINGRSIQLVDTPGFFDTDLKGEELKTELFRCITLCAPGPHAFLLVFTVGKFTSQEEEVVDLMINESFGEEALKYTTVVFTHGNQLDEGMKIEDWVKENEPLNNLVQKCGGRCHVIDNKDWNDCQKDQNQIEELLKKIDQRVRENGGGCYTNEMLQKVQKQIEEKKVEIRQSSPNIPEESLNERAIEAVCNLLYNKMSGVAVGVILGAFLGGAGVAYLSPSVAVSESLVSRYAATVLLVIVELFHILMPRWWT